MGTTVSRTWSLSNPTRFDRPRNQTIIVASPAPVTATAQ